MCNNCVSHKTFLAEKSSLLIFFSLKKRFFVMNSVKLLKVKKVASLQNWNWKTWRLMWEVHKSISGEKTQKFRPQILFVFSSQKKMREKNSKTKKSFKLFFLFPSRNAFFSVSDFEFWIIHAEENNQLVLYIFLYVKNSLKNFGENIKNLKNFIKIWRRKKNLWTFVKSKK